MYTQHTCWMSCAPGPGAVFAAVRFKTNSGCGQQRKYSADNLLHAAVQWKNDIFCRSVFMHINIVPPAGHDCHGVWPLHDVMCCLHFDPDTMHFGLLWGSRPTVAVVGSGSTILITCMQHSSEKMTYFADLCLCTSTSSLLLVMTVMVSDLCTMSCVVCALIQTPCILVCW